MRYIKWTKAEAYGLEDLGISLLLTEVDPKGLVTREIGLDQEGRVVHRAPSVENSYGYFDNLPVLVEDESRSISATEFENLWRLQK